MKLSEVILIDNLKRSIFWIFNRLFGFKDFEGQSRTFFYGTNFFAPPLFANGILGRTKKSTNAPHLLPNWQNGANQFNSIGSRFNQNFKRIFDKYIAYTFNKY